MTGTVKSTVKWRLTGGKLRSPGRPDRLPANGFVSGGTGGGGGGTGGGGGGGGFVLGVTKPDASWTGVPAGWVPARTLTTDQNLSAGGQSFIDVRFSCKVNLTSNSNTFTRCLFDGPVAAGWPGTGRPIVLSISPLVAGGVQNYFDRCTFQPQTPSQLADTFQGHNAWFNRCDFSHGVDGFDIYIPPSAGTNANVRVDGCYIHDLAFYCPSTTHSDNTTHNDGIQIENGNGVTITGTNIAAFWTLDLLSGVHIGDAWKPGNITLGSKNFCNSGNFNDGIQVAGVDIGGCPFQTGKNLGRLQGNAALQFNVASGGSTNDVHVINSWIDGGGTTCNIVGTPNISILELTGNTFTPPMYGRQQIVRALNSTAKVQVSNCFYSDGQPMLGTVGNGRYNQS